MFRNTLYETLYTKIQEVQRPYLQINLESIMVTLTSCCIWFVQHSININTHETYLQSTFDKLVIQMMMNAITSDNAFTMETNIVNLLLVLHLKINEDKLMGLRSVKECLTHDLLEVI